jgi:hypothetical protein
MRSVMNTEFGGMNAVLTDRYQQTGDGRWRNSNSGEVLAVENSGTANGTRVVQLPDTSSNDRRWRPRHSAIGYFRIQTANGGRVLGVSGASTAHGAQVLIWDDNGTNDHLWRFS